MEGKGINIGEEEEGEEKKNKRKRSKSRLECWTLASGWSNPLFVLVKFIWCECVCVERECSKRYGSTIMEVVQRGDGVL